MKNVTVLDHPLIHHKLKHIRQADTSSRQFRETISEIGSLMVYEITRNLETNVVEIETPICKTKAKELKQNVVIVPILRAGLGMVEGIHNLIPTARVGHVGMARNEETLEPVTYYKKFPKDMDKSYVIVVDPMLATGGSAAATIEAVKKAGAKEVVFVGIVGVPEGVKTINEAHPDIHIYIAALDEKLNEKGYIVPGLGDAGDRIFGTK